MLSYSHNQVLNGASPNLVLTEASRRTQAVLQQPAAVCLDVQASKFDASMVGMRDGVHVS